ncbi:MAG: GspH/FimT family pseudopilin [Cellvibrionaceae bacterium]
MKPHRSKKPSIHGFTLPELITFIAVSVGLFQLAFSSFSHLIGSVQLGSATRQFLSHYALAKTTALQRNKTIHLCVSDGSECIDSEQWHEGWIIFEDKNDNLQAEADEILRVSEPLTSGYTLTSNTSSNHLVFSPNGRVVKSNGSLPLMTFRICNTAARPENMNRNAREMVINGAGRVRLQHGRNHITECL